MRTCSLLSATFFCLFLIALSSCSSVSKKDCEKDMRGLGLAHGRAGSPKKHTDSLRSACMSKNPNIDLEAYEKGFYQGWTEYCLPNRAFEMGKKADRYFSFCPAEREALFRQKYLLGKHHYELKDIEGELVLKMNDLKSTINDNSSNFDDYNKLQAELEKVRREILALEVEGAHDSFKFR